MDVANGILGNVTAKCQGLSTTLTGGTTVTATPTTTYVLLGAILGDAG
jgi:hypothetical protein